MLPFTTYHIPEATKNQTPPDGKWLFFLHNEAITPEKNELLSKIAGALKADFDQQASVLLVTEPVSFHALIPFSSALVICFGIPLSLIGLNIEMPESGLRLMEKHTCILTQSLSALEKNANYKKALWRDMQLYLAMQTA